MQTGVGNVAPVYSVDSCMVACETAPGCSAFAYSPQDKACFLKGCPSNYTVQCPVSTLHMPSGKTSLSSKKLLLKCHYRAIDMGLLHTRLYAPTP